MKTYFAQFNRFEIELTDEAVREICHPGDNEPAILAHLASAIFHRATPDTIRAELAEYGAWDDEELGDDERNKIRIVWQAAWDIYESDEFKQSPS